MFIICIPGLTSNDLTSNESNHSETASSSKSVTNNNKKKINDFEDETTGSRIY